jgi:hypothetical protein
MAAVAVAEEYERLSWDYGDAPTPRPVLAVGIPTRKRIAIKPENLRDVIAALNEAARIVL